LPVTAESRSVAAAGFGELQANLFNRAPEAFDVFGCCLAEEQILEPRSPQDARRAAADALNLADPVERLFAAELEAIQDLLGELSRRSGLDAVAAWVQTSTSKRVMYVTFPAILRDPIDTTFFPRVQINSRVQLFETEPIERSVRLEAISTFAGTESRFRYALSIQYLADEAGVWWQVLRPIILVQPAVIDTIAALGDDARRTLLESLRLLALMVSQGSHDYLHGMMMRWFLPPAIECPPEYRRLMVEQPAPPEMQGWESRATGRVSGPVSRGDAIPISDPLEYWSLAMHAESVERIAEREPWRLDALHELQDLYAARLEAIVGMRPSTEVKAAAELLLAVSSFFLALIDPRREEPASEARPEDELLDRTTVQRFVAGFHRGLTDVVDALDRRQFVWDGVRSSIYDVLGIYMRDMQQLYDRLTATDRRLKYDVYEELARGRRLA
jgi:hypothetical protein